jgi:hypothetical protein
MQIVYATFGYVSHYWNVQKNMSEWSNSDQQFVDFIYCQVCL